MHPTVHEITKARIADRQGQAERVTRLVAGGRRAERMPACQPPAPCNAWA